MQLNISQMDSLGLHIAGTAFTNYETLVSAQVSSNTNNDKALKDNIEQECVLAL